MKVARWYDLIAPAYGRVVPRFIERTVRRAVQRVAAGSPYSLLEVGVGPGTSLVPLSKKTAAHTTAIDLSWKMLQLARHKARSTKQEVCLAQADLLHLPFDDGSFDAALSMFVLDLIKAQDIERAFRELIRVVAPGGRIVIARLDIASGAIKTVWKLAHSVLPDAVGFVRPIELSDLYEQIGLRVLRDEEIEESFGTRVTTLVKVVG